MNVPITDLQVLLSLVLPTLTALATHRLASPRLKALVLLGLSTLSTSATSFAGSSATAPAQFLSAIGLQTLLAVTAHYGLLKPAGVTGSNGIVATKVPSGLS